VPIICDFKSATSLPLIPKNNVLPCKIVDGQGLAI